jgi:hypothetical protein
MSGAHQPAWNANNLRRHHRERLRKDPGCFEDLLGITGRTMTQSEYELRSLDAVTNSWGKYAGDSWNPEDREYREASVYFVDDDLVVAITDTFEREFITCFHEHFGYRHGGGPGPGASVGQAAAVQGPPQGRRAGEADAERKEDPRCLTCSDA